MTNEVMLDCSRPVKPTDNAFIELFNAAGFAMKCLNVNWFLSPRGCEGKIQSFLNDNLQLQ
jgi:putative transposase